MTAAFAANTPRHIRGIGSVLEVDSPGSGKSGLQRCGPLLIGPGEPPHLVRGQTWITEHRAERLPAADRVQELLTHLDREPLLRPGSSTSPLVVGVCLVAEVAAAPAVATQRSCRVSQCSPQNASPDKSSP